MSPLPISATRPAADHAPVDYSASFIRPHLPSSTSHPPSCNFNSFPNSRKSPSSVVTRASTSKMVGEGEEDGCGLGIVQFLRDKNLLITGATGFVGKVLVEKILRSQPEIGRLFLLIKGPNQEAVVGRLKQEIINDELFERLKEIHGSSYETFMLSKLVPVVGHLQEESLGMEERVEKDIADEVEVIVSCAANTRFDERYDVAMNTNTRGASRLVKLARSCKKLQVFLHVSTAYVNGRRTGLIKETPFFLGDSLAREEALAAQADEIPPTLDIGAEIEIIKDTLKGQEENMAPPAMKELGVQRAKMHGWPNVYSFTKAMGEMMIGTMSDDIPTVIVRPTIISSTIRDPFPGWIQGFRTVDPIIAYFGKGLLNLFTADGKSIIDLIPADMVVNAILAAATSHGSSGAAGINIYHIGSSSVNPLRYGELFEHCYEHFLSFPFIDSQGKAVHLERIKLFDTLAAIQSYLSAETNGVKGIDMILKKISMTYEPYTRYSGRFDIANANKLMKQMSREERLHFPFDVAAIQWRDYIVDVHIHGLRKHVIRR
ncbi:unnamed protein product [Victoria cruziana]